MSVVAQPGFVWKAGKLTFRRREVNRVPQLPCAFVIADAHVDLLLELAHCEHRLGERDVFSRTWLPLLQRGGVALQICPIFVGVDRQPEGTLREALGQAASFLAAANENPDSVVHVRRRADLDAVEQGERIGLLLSIEGVEPFGYELWPLDAFWELGLRMASLTWNRRNPYADGTAETGGLSALGRSLVDRFRERGVVIDLAHASSRLFDEVLARSGDAPVLVSHAACRALHDHPRNLTDDQLLALAGRGGLLGVMLLPFVIDPAQPTIDRAIDHLEHAAAIVGVEHVCLGGDFTHRVDREVPATLSPPDPTLPPSPVPAAALQGLAGPEDYPVLVEALMARGWGADDIAAVTHRNLFRFLRTALPA